MIRSFKYRIYPDEAQARKLQWVLDRCRELYNAALQERKEAYKYAGQSIGYVEQCHSIVEIKTECRPEYQEIGSHVLYDVLRRLDKAYKAFFRRIRAGEKPGYPRFQGRNRYDSFTYPDASGWKREEKHLVLSKIGSMRMRGSKKQPLTGTIKTLTIKREGQHWYASFICEVEAPEKLPASYEDTGIDLGVTHFAALSNGEFIEPPKYYRKAEKRLKKLQEALSRKKRGSNRRKKAVQAVARAHRKVRNQRIDFAHKASRQIVNRYQVIALENLQAANLVKRPKPKQDENGKYLPNRASAKSGLNKSIHDAGWSMFTSYLRYKAECAGRSVVFVNPKYTSQICSGCGSTAKKDLSERWHSCECGCELDRDTNAAINILRLGRSLQEQS